MITYISAFIALFTSNVLLAQTFHERAEKIYLETDRNFDLDCFYSGNRTFKLITAQEETKLRGQTLSRNFTIETTSEQVPLHFSLERKGRSLEYSVKIQNQLYTTGKFSKREFFLPYSKDQSLEQRLEVSRIYCMVNFAYAYPHSLTDGDYHFNVHPHKKYDWQSRLKQVTEKYLNDTRYSSIIFLETGNYRGNLVNVPNFFDGIFTKLPPTPVDSDLENVPVEVPLIVSPAGNNRFEMLAQNQVNITFSGGNHNYCIWNVTRHVLEGLMRSHSKARIKLQYDTSAIVAQTKGIEGLALNFPRGAVNKSNLLKDLLNDKKQSETYHFRFLNYFKNYMARQFSGMYRTYKIRYQAEHYAEEVVLEGQGSRDLEVEFIYF